MEYEGDGEANCDWRVQYRHQSIGTGTGGSGNKRTCGNHPNYRFIKIGQNTKKNPGDLRRLSVTQTPVENYQLTLVEKNSQMSRGQNTEKSPGQLR